jgi:hypothetical protein
MLTNVRQRLTRISQGTYGQVKPAISHFAHELFFCAQGGTFMKTLCVPVDFES